MKKQRQRGSRGRWATGLVVCSVVCVAGCAARSERSTAPADSAASGEAQAEEASPSRAAAPRAAPLQEGPSGSAQASEFDARSEKEDSADGAPKKSVSASRLELADEVAALEHDIAPEQLSCAGARPHRDAICSIAARLCELPPQGTPTVGPDASCLEARDSCTKAKTKFKARCGAD